jgi:hypothetical protein
MVVIDTVTYHSKQWPSQRKYGYPQPAILVVTSQFIKLANLPLNAETDSDSESQTFPWVFVNLLRQLEAQGKSNLI